MLLFLLAQGAAAVVAPAAAPAPATAQPAVVSYPPEFFADVHPNTALDMINRLPGFALDSGSDVRGYEGAAGNVLIDGRRPATKTEGIGSILQRVLATRVARIDVIRGGAPGIDMQGKTVIANVIVKAGGGVHGVFAVANDQSADGRNKDTVRLEASGQLGQRTWESGLLVGGFTDDSYGDGPRTQTNAAGTPILAAHIHSQAGGTQSSLTGATEGPLGDGRLRINGRLAGTVYNSDELDTVTLPDNHTEHDHQDDNKGQSELGGRYNQNFGARTSIEAVVLRQDARERYADAFTTPSDAEIFKQATDTSETIVRGVVKFQQRPRLSWEVGAEGAYNTLINHILFSHNGAFVALPAANVAVNEKRAEGFVKAVWQPVSTITVEGAVREEGSRIASSGDVTLQKTLYYTKPRVLLTWAPNANTQVRLRYEREVGQLDFGSFTASTTLVAGVVSAGNPNLAPQQDWVSEIALDQHFLGSGGVTLTARHLQISDAVDRAPIFLANGTAFDAPANIGAGTEDDFISTVTLPLDRLGLKGAQLRGDLTRRWSQVTDPTTHRPRPISGEHPTDWEAHFSQPIGNVLYGIDVYGGWQQRYYRFNQIEIDKLGTNVTPFLEWKPRPDLSWRIELDNVTARGFKHTYESFSGPRNIDPLASVDQRSVHPGRLFHLRLRKTFGN
jgi:hypothetical protein